MMAAPTISFWKAVMRYRLPARSLTVLWWIVIHRKQHSLRARTPMQSELAQLRPPHSFKSMHQLQVGRTDGHESAFASLSSTSKCRFSGDYQVAPEPGYAPCWSAGQTVPQCVRCLTPRKALSRLRLGAPSRFVASRIELFSKRFHGSPALFFPTAE